MKGYRTIAVNLALMLLALTDYFIANGTLVAQVVENPKASALVVAGINVLNIVLRFATTSPVGRKE